MYLMVRKAMLKLRGSKRYEYLREYEQLQWQNLDKIENYQFYKLKKLFNHAYKSVPYYKNLFKNLGIHPDDIHNKDDYSKIPILTKNIIKANQHELISDRFDLKTLIRNTTGGSTGEPLQFYREKDVYEQKSANLMLGLKMAGWNEKKSLILIWGNPKDIQKKNDIILRLKSIFSMSVTLNAYKYDQRSFDSWIQTILNSGNNVYIYGYPSVISDFAYYISSKKINIENVKAIQTSAEQLLPEQKEIIENVFKCKAFDQYGSRECPGISCECEKGSMHIFCHSNLVEFIDDPSTPEGTKKLIVTPLSSYAMPFIRYEIGDFAFPLEDQCSCGRGFPLMQMKIGRIYDRFICANGQVVHGTLLVRQVAGIKGIKNFQFHQKDFTNINLFIVKTSSFDDADEEKINSIGKKISAFLGSDVNLDINYVESIPQTIGGKHRQFISDMRFS